MKSEDVRTVLTEMVENLKPWLTDMIRREAEMAVNGRLMSLIRGEFESEINDFIGREVRRRVAVHVEVK